MKETFLFIKQTHMQLGIYQNSMKKCIDEIKEHGSDSVGFPRIVVQQKK